MSAIPNKTVWFFMRQSKRARRIWAGIFSAKRVRRAQWERALATAVETLLVVEPFIVAEEVSRYVTDQLETIAQEVEKWPRD